MLRVVICDDEKEMRAALRKVVDRELSLKGLAFEIIEYGCGEDLAFSNDGAAFDIIFLDIEMKEMSGTETAKIIRRVNNRAVIVFVTAFPDFVFQGYEVKALNYILKPYQDKKIIEVLNLALKELSLADPLYFVVQKKSGAVKIALSDTRYFFSEKRVCTAVTKTSSVTFYGKLGDLEGKLPGFFIRIHNRYLVNMGYVTEVSDSQVNCGGELLPLSGRYKQGLWIAFAKDVIK